MEGRASAATSVHERTRSERRKSGAPEARCSAAGRSDNTGGAWPIGVAARRAGGGGGAGRRAQNGCGTQQLAPRGATAPPEPTRSPKEGSRPSCDAGCWRYGGAGSSAWTHEAEAKDATTGWLAATADAAAPSIARGGWYLHGQAVQTGAAATAKLEEAMKKRMSPAGKKGASPPLTPAPPRHTTAVVDRPPCRLLTAVETFAPHQPTETRRRGMRAAGGATEEESGAAAPPGATPRSRAPAQEGRAEGTARSGGDDGRNDNNAAAPPRMATRGDAYVVVGNETTPHTVLS